MRAALVTGGSSGIGFAISCVLREEGFELTLAARRPAPLERAVAELGAHAVGADVADAVQVGRMVEAHLERWDRLDMLVNAAGAAAAAPLGRTTPDRLEVVHATNVRGAIEATRRALPALRAARGMVVNVTSIVAVRPAAELTAYATSKAALHAFTEVVNREEERHGVRATSIAPALVDTPLAVWPRGRRGELITPGDCAEVVRCLVRIGPTARIPEVLIERMPPPGATDD